MLKHCFEFHTEDYTEYQKALTAFSDFHDMVQATYTVNGVKVSLCSTDSMYDYAVEVNIEDIPDDEVKIWEDILESAKVILGP